MDIMSIQNDYFSEEKNVSAIDVGQMEGNISVIAIETVKEPSNRLNEITDDFHDDFTTVGNMSPVTGRSKNSIHSRNWREKKKEQTDFLEKEKIRKRNERKNMTPEQKERVKEQNRKRQQVWRERQKKSKYENEYPSSDEKRQKYETITTSAVAQSDGLKENEDCICVDDWPDLDTLEELDTSEILEGDFYDILQSDPILEQNNSNEEWAFDLDKENLINSMGSCSLSDAVPISDSNLDIVNNPVMDCKSHVPNIGIAFDTTTQHAETINQELSTVSRGNLPNFCVLEIEEQPKKSNDIPRDDIQRQDTSGMLQTLRDMKGNSHNDIELLKQEIKRYSSELQLQIKKVEEECLRVCDEYGKQNDSVFKYYEQKLNKRTGEQHKTSDDFVLVLGEEEYRQSRSLPQPTILHIFYRLDCIPTLSALYNSFKTFLETYSIPCYLPYHSL